jgi:signal transduction histidine kinase
VNAVQALEGGGGSEPTPSEPRKSAPSASSEVAPPRGDVPLGARSEGDRADADREATIWIETWVEGDMAVVAVEDSGPGVPTHLERRIFDPFFTTKPRGQGTGLGLSISTDIARRHGGSLTLERPARGMVSGAGDGAGGAGSVGGSRFICRIPLGKREPSRPDARTSQAPS